MRLCKISFLLMLMHLIAGCSHEFTRSEYKDSGRSYEDFVNNKIKDRSVLIRLITGEEIGACNVSIVSGRDSLVYTLLTPFAQTPLVQKGSQASDNLADNSSTYTLALSRIRSISFSDRTGSILKGMGTGLAVGAAVGSVTLNVDPETSNSGQHNNAWANALTGAAIGAVSGTIIGYFIGEKYTFILTQ